MMWWGNGGSWVLPLFLVMALACVAVMAGMMRHGGSGHGSRSSDSDEDEPERILARRLASGEIDVTEFERRRDALKWSANSSGEELHTTDQ